MPITFKAVPPFVQSVGSGPGGGTVKGEAMKRLQAQQADHTDFTSCLRVRIQHCSRIAAMVRDTPPCKDSTRILCTSFLVNMASAGRHIGYFP